MNTPLTKVLEPLRLNNVYLSMFESMLTVNNFFFGTRQLKHRRKDDFMVEPEHFPGKSRLKIGSIEMQFAIKIEMAGVVCTLLTPALSFFLCFCLSNNQCTFSLMSVHRSEVPK